MQNSVQDLAKKVINNLDQGKIFQEAEAKEYLKKEYQYAEKDIVKLLEEKQILIDLIKIVSDGNSIQTNKLLLEEPKDEKLSMLKKDEEKTMLQIIKDSKFESTLKHLNFFIGQKKSTLQIILKKEFDKNNQENFSIDDYKLLINDWNKTLISYRRDLMSLQDTIATIDIYPPEGRDGPNYDADDEEIND